MPACGRAVFMLIKQRLIQMFPQVWVLDFVVLVVYLDIFFNQKF